MNTKEAAKLWGVEANWVAGRCRERLIPFAEKRAFGWDIPDEAMKPPMTGHKAAVLLKYVQAINEGGNPRLSKSYEVCYHYLEYYGFISALQRGKALKDRLKNVQVLELGEELIDLDKFRNKKTNVKTHVKLNAGVVEAGIEMSKDAI